MLHFNRRLFRAGQPANYFASTLTGPRERLILAPGSKGLTQKGEVHLIEPRPDRFTVLSTLQTPDDTRALAWAHPVICAGRLYIRRGEYLYVYDVSAK